MGKIDEKKEYIGLLKSYLGIIVAFILSVGAGISKLYISQNINLLFWLGVLLLFFFIGLFIIIARKAHNEVKNLKDLKD
jgi:membrane protein YdbS with pleckstrin-like domain